MAKSLTKKKALAALNYDLFQPPVDTPPPPLKIKVKPKLPPVEELYRMFDMFNLLYWGGKLPRVKIEYSSRMMSAGSYTPSMRLIKIGRKYHEIFPEDLSDTLKHEMIHIIHIRHDAAFKREASRVGSSVKARYHPSLRKPPRYIYVCPNCKKEYPRQKQLRMASCGDCSKGGKYDERYKLKAKKKTETVN